MFTLLLIIGIIEGILWIIIWGNYYSVPRNKKEMKNEDDYIEEYGRICSYFDSHPNKK